MGKDFDLSDKDGIVSIEINISIKNNAAEGTSEKVNDLLESIEQLINNYNTNNENIFIKNSIGTVLTHKEKQSK